MLEYLPISDQLIKITFSAKPTNLRIIQAYKPTIQRSDEEEEYIYNQIETVISTIHKKEHVIILDDWNAKVGEGQSEEHLKGCIGEYGLGTQNTRGERLIQFAIINLLYGLLKA